MSTAVKTIIVKNSASSGARVTGLTPTWKLFKDYATNTDQSSNAVVTELDSTNAPGVYEISYDVYLHGAARGELDLGSALTIEGDRYILVTFTGIDAAAMDNAIEGEMSLIDAHQAALSALIGTLATAGMNPEVYKNRAGTTTRLSVANDVAGNRTASTYTH